MRVTPISNDTSLIVKQSQSEPKMISVVNIRTDKVLFQDDIDGGVYAFSHNNQLLSVGMTTHFELAPNDEFPFPTYQTKGFITIIDFLTGEIIQFESEFGINSVSYSPEDDTLIVAEGKVYSVLEQSGSVGRVRTIDPKSGETLKTWSNKYGKKAVISEKSKYLVLDVFDYFQDLVHPNWNYRKGTLSIFDYNGFRSLMNFGNLPILDFALSPDEKFLILRQDSYRELELFEEPPPPPPSAILLNLDSLKVLHEFPSSMKMSSPICFSPLHNPEQIGRRFRVMSATHSG